ncbi:Hypothetical protein Bdt_0524 [Bdellovibrio bacteriovorus str. Tiberius]|uniref:Uncharacterized protein n=1 Tax=Bdellovibrio bacteriovorus str. Tiberius TaxID=1069642 RepID=K7ZE81_BDEBC|nr:Hypothetical protein Bdt_0524 [Bdellovibrio bacteriovorus str. Tiberius]
MRPLEQAKFPGDQAQSNAVIFAVEQVGALREHRARGL